MDQLYVRIGNRLIFDFEKIPWKGCGKGWLDPDIKDYVPKELHEAGVTSHKWNEWISEFEDINKRLGMNGWSLLASLLIPTCGLIVYCYLCFPPARKHCLSWYPGCYGSYHEALRIWQEKV